MATSSSLQIALRKEKDKQILRDLREDIQEHRAQIRESKSIARAWRNEAMQKEEEIQTGGTVLILSGLIASMIGGGMGTLAQRYLMGTKFSATLKAPLKVPLTTWVSWPIAVGTAVAVPNRLGKTILAGFFGGMGGGAFVGKLMNPSGVPNDP